MGDVTRILSAIERGDRGRRAAPAPGLRRAAQAGRPAAGARERRARRSRPRRWSTRRTCGWSAPSRDRHLDGRGHFFAAAAEAMRRILVDRARDRKRRRSAAATAGACGSTSTPSLVEPPGDDLLALDEALTGLAREDPAGRRAGQAPLLRRPDARPRRPRSWASAAATADRDWAYARAWLCHALAGDPIGPAETEKIRRPWRTRAANGALKGGPDRAARPRDPSAIARWQVPMSQAGPDVKAIFIGGPGPRPAGPDREAYLDAACGGDAGAAARVEDLLAAL